MNHQQEDRMSDALRRLNAMAPQGASEALGEKLKDEFRRHHSRRRLNQAARLSMLAACLAGAVVVSIVLLRPRSTTTRVPHELSHAAAPRSETVSTGLTEPVIPKQIARKLRVPVVAAKNPPVEADRFVALPTFDPGIPIDRLQMVRLNLPGRDLQLVGFPVSEEIAERRVVADVLLAQDGTPYALRLVRSSVTKEQ